MIKPAKYILILLVVGLLVSSTGKGSSAHQNRPDLSGTWAMDISLSDFGKYAQKSMADVELIFIITHQEPELKVTLKAMSKKRERVVKLIYYTDGRGEKNPGLMDRDKIKSKTAWEGNKIVTKSVGRLSWNANFYRYDVTDSWELSPDGQMLIHTSLRTKPKDMGGMGTGNLYLTPVVKRVFKRIA